MITMTIISGKIIRPLYIITLCDIIKISVSCSVYAFIFIFFFYHTAPAAASPSAYPINPK